MLVPKVRRSRKGALWKEHTSEKIGSTLLCGGLGPVNCNSTPIVSSWKVAGCCETRYCQSHELDEEERTSSLTILSDGATTVRGWRVKVSWDVWTERKRFCATPGADDVPSWGEAGKYSLVEKGGAWGDRGGPKMSWKSASSSRARKLRSHGRCNPCALRTNTDNEKLRILTTYKSEAMVSMKESPKPVKIDSEAIPAYPNVVVERRAWMDVERVKVRPAELENSRNWPFYNFAKKKKKKREKKPGWDWH